jgi:hypothetical protein
VVSSALFRMRGEGIEEGEEEEGEEKDYSED